MSKIKEFIYRSDDGNLMTFEERLKQIEEAFNDDFKPIIIADLSFNSFKELIEAIKTEEENDK
jgi:hypothetical protein